jgi:hypothetical protein
MRGDGDRNRACQDGISDHHLGSAGHRDEPAADHLAGADHDPDAPPAAEP